MTGNNGYRQRVLAAFGRLVQGSVPFRRALDFGAGDGWVARQIVDLGWAREVCAVDVQLRKRTFHPVQAYDGLRLPFPDRSFDLVLSVDVLHHCPDPVKSLKDVLRVCRSTFLIKDHTYSSRWDFSVLSFLDELGNRRFGVPSRYRYQKGWSWSRTLEEEGFRQGALENPVHCGRFPFAWTDRLQYAARWERASNVDR